MKNNRLIVQLREVLGRAYGFVRGREFTKDFANLTYEDLVDEAIDRLKYNTTGRDRSSVRDRIVKIRQELTDAVTTIKKQPPSAWVMAAENQGATLGSTFEAEG